MKIKLLFTLIILLTINLVSAQSFRTLFKESFALLEQDNYEKALPILLEMHDLQPNNANTKFSLQTGISELANTAAVLIEKADNSLTQPLLLISNDHTSLY